MQVGHGADALLCDLLMAVMRSVAAWVEAVDGDPDLALRWRDAAAARMRAAGRYVPYEEVVRAAAADAGAPAPAPQRLIRAWPRMRPWPDAAELANLRMPYAFVTNCSRSLAGLAAERSGLSPRFVLSAEEAGSYKPAVAIYHEACRRLGVEPGRVAFAAGSPYDAVGARDAGLRAWLVARRPVGGPLPGVRIVPSLADVLSGLEGPDRNGSERGAQRTPV